MNNPNTYSVDMLSSIINEAKVAAAAAAQEACDQYGDVGACGFAWVEIFGIKGSTKLGRALKKAGMSKNYRGAYQIWNPSGMFVQSVIVLEKGAEAAAEVFKSYGFKQVYASSRLD